MPETFHLTIIPKMTASRVRASVRACASVKRGNHVVIRDQGNDLYNAWAIMQALELIRGKSRAG